MRIDEKIVSNIPFYSSSIWLWDFVDFLVPRLKKFLQSSVVDIVHFRLPTHPDTHFQSLAISVVHFVSTLHNDRGFCRSQWSVMSPCASGHSLQCMGFNKQRRPVLTHVLHSQTADAVVFSVIGVLSSVVPKQTCFSNNVHVTCTEGQIDLFSNFYSFDFLYWLFLFLYIRALLEKAGILV